MMMWNSFWGAPGGKKHASQATKKTHLVLVNRCQKFMVFCGAAKLQPVIITPHSFPQLAYFPESGYS